MWYATNCAQQVPPNVSSYRGALDASLAAEQFNLAPPLFANVAAVEVGRCFFIFHCLTDVISKLKHWPGRQNSQRCQEKTVNFKLCGMSGCISECR
jgi:hypothetical protein